MNHELSKKTFATLTAIAIVSGLAGGALSERFLDDDATVSNGDLVQPVKMELVDEKSQVIDAIQAVSPSVVSIVITQELKNIRSQGMSPFDLFFQDDPFFRDFFGGPQFERQPEPQENDEPIKQKVGGGSGFIVSKEGMILTNRHVVASDEAEYTVILQDGTEFKAEVVSRDPFNDIAVIKLVAEDGEDLPELKPVSFGSSNDLKIGQSVIAIGNALAEFANSATKGIVSAKGRQILASDGSGRGENLSGLIQTDAAINPGNSGGPLINLAGEVVGINTAIAQGANGIGFAIPIDDVKPVLKSVETHGKIVRPILGVMFTMLTPELAKELGLEVEEGALLKGDGQSFAVLPNKPAEKAGLLEKDVITEVNGVKVTVDNPLQREIMKYAPGDKLKIKYLRNGKEMETEVTLGEAETGVGEE
ncbi:MAG: S1C family serine protease [Candidatus Altimarinota bacterium]